MKLSIIIVSYNTRELLRKCLESLGQYAIRNTQYEIIVVDNGSTDGSAELVQSSKFKVKSFSSPQEFLQNSTGQAKLKVIRNNSNLGFSRAVNQALRQAQGKVILLLNSDTQVKPETLEKLLEFEEKVRPAIIGARLLNPDGSIQSSVFRLPTIKRAIQEYWLERKGAFSKYAPEGGEPVKVEAVLGGAMLISRGVIEKIGLFDERYFMYYEDLDYCRRAKKAGFRVYYLPSAKVIHEHGASGKSLAKVEDQWKRLVPSSKIYHGFLKHYLINFILWVGQKL